MQTKTLYIDTLRCPANHKCPALSVCPYAALSQNGYNAPRVDMDKCIKCGKCVNTCPMKALRIQ